MLLVLPLRKAEDDEQPRLTLPGKTKIRQANLQPYRAEDTDFRTELPRHVVSTYNEHVHLHPADVEKAMTGNSPIKATMNDVEDHGDSAKMTFDLTRGDRSVGTMQRSIGTDPDTGEKVAHHLELKLDPDQQGQGHATEFLRSQMGLYQQLGVDKIHTFAGLENGAYTWAKMGFHPNQYDKDLNFGTWRQHVAHQLENPPEGKTISPEAKRRVQAHLADPSDKAIWKVADESEKLGPDIAGKKAPTLGQHLLMGSNWFGHFDMHDPEATERFQSYADRKLGGGE